MAESWNKKERERKKQQNKKEKEERRLERKNNPSNDNKFEVPFAYVDENGNLSSEPPDPSKKRETNVEDIIIGIPKQDELAAEDPVKRGTVTFFNEAKGYGFIKEKNSQKDFFVHSNHLLDPIKERSEVSFEIGKGPKGLIAIKVKLV
jgi:Cold shock proteins